MEPKMTFEIVRPAPGTVYDEVGCTTCSWRMLAFDLFDARRQFARHTRFSHTS